jgi:hypothetical protein
MKKNQSKGIFVVASEYVQLMGNLDKNGNEALRGFLLKLFNGSTTETFSHQTKTGTNVQIDKVLGCALMGAQTGVLARDLADLDTGKKADGLLQRFILLYVNPVISRIVDDGKTIDSRRVDNLFALLYRHDKHIYVDWADQEAKDAYIEFDYSLRLKNQVEISAIKSFKDKYAGLSVRLAYMFAQCNASTGQIIYKISRQDFLCAERLLFWISKNLDLIWRGKDHDSALRGAEAIHTLRKAGTLYDGLTFDIKLILPLSKNCTSSDIMLGVELLCSSHHLRLTNRKIYFNPSL